MSSLESPLGIIRKLIPKFQKCINGKVRINNINCLPDNFLFTFFEHKRSLMICINNYSLCIYEIDSINS